jgi:CheY-like chemotaxis protein
VARQDPSILPAAALSAYAPGQDLPQALASGFRMQLGKPLDPKALIAAVGALAGRTHGRGSGKDRVPEVATVQDLPRGLY